MNYIYKHKYLLYIVIILFSLLLSFYFGYNKGNENVKIIKDTVTISDTFVKTDTFYKIPKIDTIIIDTNKYITKSSIYRFKSNGFAKVNYIPRKDLFKWTVKEPSPIIYTQYKYKTIKVPTVDYKITTISTIIGFLSGVLVTISFMK